MTDSTATPEDLAWFETAPIQVLDERIGIGHGMRGGERLPFVLFALEIDGEPIVYALTAERADMVADRLRRSAGAVRAMTDQEREP